MRSRLRQFTNRFVDVYTSGLTGVQFGAQALFFFVVPSALPSEPSASILLAYVYASALGQLTPFGLQYLLLRAFVTDDSLRISRIRGLLWLVVPLALLATLGYSQLYASESTGHTLFAGVLVVSFSTRAISSAVLQANNTYHKVQIGTIFAAALRTLSVLVSRDADPLVVLAIAESVITLGWHVAARSHWVKFDRAVPTADDLREAGAFFLSATSRIGLMEIDKLLFAAFASPTAFIAYTLASKIYAGASAFVGAYFARETPQVISASTHSDLQRVRTGAIPTTMFGVFTIALATAGASLFFAEIWASLAVSAGLLTVALVANAANTPMLDFIFYNRSVLLRIALQVGGMAIVVVGTALGSNYIGAVAPAASVMLASVCTALALMAMSRRVFSE